MCSQAREEPVREGATGLLKIDTSELRYISMIQAGLSGDCKVFVENNENLIFFQLNIMILKLSRRSPYTFLAHHNPGAIVELEQDLKFAVYSDITFHAAD